MPNKNLPLIHPLGYKSNVLISVVETPVYLARAAKLLSEDERDGIVNRLAADPECGVLIPGTGGLRKLRTGLDGRGKRGGARVIYLFLDLETPILLLLIYAKNERDDMTPVQKAVFARLVDELKRKR
jgi:mRNA-degrading endonuclease RelE of RelBE toxin-antitoxin system